MSYLADNLSECVRDSFRKAFPERIDEFDNVAVVASANPQFGDFQCNDAMGLAKVLKKKPQEIAALAADIIRESRYPFIEKVETAGPGFINIEINKEWLGKHLESIFSDPFLGVERKGAGKKVVIDYSSPNVAKPMHIGHIRSTNIGNAIDRIYRFLGYNVISDNHLGDWGTQFGLLIHGFRNFADLDAYEKDPIEELERVYVKSYEMSQADPNWRDSAKAELVKLQKGDKENLDLWRSFVEHSMREFEKIYRRLDVKFDLTRGESWYNDKLPGLVSWLVEIGLAVESDGALIVDLSGESMPACIVRKSDGGFNYATTDIATILSREEEFDPDFVVYVTDERQQLHFKQVFSIASKIGVNAKLIHVWFGLMRLPEGTFSTRQGNVIKLEKLLDEAERRALEIVKRTRPEMNAEQQLEIARAVGIGAVRYADLCQNPQSLVTFTWDKAMALEGNSGPYLQYAYARIASVMDKYSEQFKDRSIDDYPVIIENPYERRLAIHLIRFGEAVERAAAQFKPSVLCDYLFELAQIYSGFYQNVPFLKAEEGVRESRVKLCGITAAVLKKGLNLLGIETLERI